MSFARGTRFLHRIWYRYTHVETSFKDRMKKEKKYIKEQNATTITSCKKSMSYLLYVGNNSTNV